MSVAGRPVSDVGSATQPIVALSGVSVRYDTGDAWIGSHIDLDIHLGEVILLLGPSGCGKSTLMLTVPGLIPASVPADLRGHVLCNGTDTRAAGAGSLAGSVGTVFQDPDAQIVTATLLDEVCFGLENLLVPVDDIEGLALAALQQVGLASDRAEALRSPAELSGGGRQRLAIACALALDPAVLVLDEPTANLDPVAAAEFYETLAGLCDPSRAIVLVEHELDDALPIADRIVVLDKSGTIVHDGAPAEVIGVHARELRDCGVWLPTATEIALRLGLDRGVGPGLPLTFSDLSEALALREFVDPAAIASPPEARTAPGSEPALRSTGVSVELGGRRVLDGVDLAIRSGEFLAIAGANGAGKSTLIRALAGLLPLADGAVTVHGRPLETMNAREVGDRIGYVFQNPEHQFVTASVRDELAYGLRVRRRPEDEIASAVAQMLDRFDLARYCEVSPFLLSHGEKRRLSVATALITEPSIVILDEPTFGQDRARADEIVALAQELNAAGTTIVMVTHDLQLIADHAHRVALLSAGRLVDLGPTADVLCHDELIAEAGLRIPPVHRLARLLAEHRPEWSGVYRIDQLPQAVA